MGTLVKFELKKLLSKKMNIIVIIVCLFLIILLFSMTGKDFTTTDKNGNSYKGTQAIDIRKEQIKEISGNLTNKRIVEEIQKLQELRNDENNLVTNSYGELDFSPKIYNEYLNNRLNLLTNINRVYADYNASYITELFNINLDEQKDFYETRQQRIEEKLNQNYNGKTYSNQEKQYWLEKSKNIETPFEYDFYYGYSNLYSTYEMLIIGIIAICICLAPVFDGEYQSGTDKILLTTKYGKSKGITAKIIASYIFATVVFTIYLICAGRNSIFNVWYKWRKLANTTF